MLIKSVTFIATLLVLQGCVEAGIFDSVKNTITQFVDTNTKIINGAVTSVHNDAKTTLEQTTNVVSNVIDKAIDVIENIQDTTSNAVNGVIENVNNVAEHVSDKLSNIGEVIGNASDKVNDAANSISDKITNASDKVNEAVESISDKISNASDKANEIAENVSEKIKESVDKVNNIVDNASDKINDTIDKVSDKIDETKININEAATNCIKVQKDALLDLPHTILKNSMECVTNVTKNILGQSKDILTKINNLHDIVVSGNKDINECNIINVVCQTKAVTKALSEFTTATATLIPQIGKLVADISTIKDKLLICAAKEVVIKGIANNAIENAKKCINL